MRASPALVVGVVTSFGPDGPLAGAPAYDLVAQAHAGLAHRARVARRPRAGARGRHPDGRPHRRASCSRPPFSRRSCARGRRGSGSSSRSRSSPPRSRCRSRISSGSRASASRRCSPTRARARGPRRRDRGRRRDEPVLPLLRGGRRVRRGRVPQPRAAPRRSSRSSGSTTRRSTRPTSFPRTRTCSPPSVALTAEIERAFAGEPVDAWLERLRAAGVPVRAGAHARGPPRRSAGVCDGPHRRGLASRPRAASACSGRSSGRVRHRLRPPALGADTDAVLGALG